MRTIAVCALVIFVLHRAVTAQPATATPGPAPPTILPPPTVPPGIPLKALKHRATLIREVNFYWGLGTRASTFFAQVHKESTFNEDAHSPFADGIAQFTPDTAADAQKLFPSELKEFCEIEGGCPMDVRWALRALVLWDRRLHTRRSFADGDERWGFALADYNGGPGWINRERAICATTNGCNPNLYFGHVQSMCGKSKPGRSVQNCAGQNQLYAGTILHRLAPLYDKWLGAQ
jgi:hypothetical protein